jgi:hypothetical protein
MKVTYAIPTKAPAGPKVARVARLLALAHKFQGMLDRGEVESMADLARLGRVSRARITQIMDLLMLAPEIQEELLLGADHLGLRDVLSVVKQIEWIHQRAAFRKQSSSPLQRIEDGLDLRERRGVVELMQDGPFH